MHGGEVPGRAGLVFAQQEAAPIRRGDDELTALRMEALLEHARDPQPALAEDERARLGRVFLFPAPVDLDAHGARLPRPAPLSEYMARARVGRASSANE